MNRISAERMLSWCGRLLAGREAARNLELMDYVHAIPKLESLSDVPSGTVVLVRGDVDAKPGPSVGEGDIRLRSMLATLEFGRRLGWKQVIFGHIGREADKSLSKVGTRLGELLKCEVPLITNWLDNATVTISEEASNQVRSAPPGSVVLLENTRRYDIERTLWKATAEDLPQLVARLARLAEQFADKLGSIYVHEAFSAGSRDASSTVVPAAMERVAFGKYEAEQFLGPLMRCLETELVIFSGLKVDKLDDLEAMISRGKIREVFTAGSLAMALKKAIAQLEGSDFCIGVAEDPGHRDKPYYIPPDRIEQARRMVADGREKGIRFVVPVDFVIQDGSLRETLSSADQQLDIGPQSSQLFAQKIDDFIGRASKGAVAFHNGVFGKFEDARFEEGTRRFVEQLRRMQQAEIEVYIGGGEGGAALEKYGDPSWVTHVFTAGGTVLNALGSEPVPYLVALRAAGESR